MLPDQDLVLNYQLVPANFRCFFFEPIHMWMKKRKGPLPMKQAEYVYIDRILQL